MVFGVIACAGYCTAPPMAKEKRRQLAKTHQSGAIALLDPGRSSYLTTQRHGQNHGLVRRLAAGVRGTGRTDLATTAATSAQAGIGANTNFGSIPFDVGRGHRAESLGARAL